MNAVRRAVHKGRREPSLFAVMGVHGDLDFYTAPALRQCLLDLIGQGHRRLVVDLDRVEFIDSAGLGAMIAGLKRLRDLDGDLEIVCSRPNTLRLFETTGLNGVFQISANLDEATVRYGSRQEGA